MINQLPINVLSEMQFNNLLAVPLDSITGSSTQEFLAQYLQILEQIGSVEPSVGRPPELQTLASKFGNHATPLNTQDLPMVADVLRVVLERNKSVPELPPSGNSLPPSAPQRIRDALTSAVSIPMQSDGAHVLEATSKLEAVSLHPRMVTAADGAESHQSPLTPASVSQVATATPAAHATYLVQSGIESGSVFMSSVHESSTVLAKELSLEVPLGQPKWDQALANRVLWMINNDHLRADLRLNPPQLGPLDVRISIEGDQTNIHFSSPHGVVRESLENALPQLREMLSESGHHQVDVNVSQQGLADHRGEASRDLDGAKRDIGADLDDASADSSHAAARFAYRGVGLVDYYI